MTIDERIRALTRDDYDRAMLQALPEPHLASAFRFYRLTELARFWNSEQEGSESLAARREAMLMGFYGLSTAWAHVVIGGGGKAEIYLGLPGPSGGGKSDEQLLGAQLPGSAWMFESQPQPLLQRMTCLPWVAALSGNPALTGSETKNTRSVENQPIGMESLFETLAGCRWAYVVLADPVVRHQVQADLTSLENEMKELRSSFMRRGSAEDNNNPTVARYVRLLEAAHDKLAQCRGTWDVQSYLMAESEFDLRRGAQTLYSALGGAECQPQPFRITMGSRHSVSGSQWPLITRLNSAEAAAWSGLPRREIAGLQLPEFVPFGMNGGGGGEDGVALGKVMSGSTVTSRWYDIPRDSFSKHMLVAGVPGSGKTQTCFYILSQLWREHGIPWLVLEPSMKSEYRALMRSALGSAVRVFTAGNELVSPLRLNPLEVPAGVHVQTHVGAVMTLFRATFVMEAPMPYVLEAAMHAIYQARGWNFVTGEHPTRDDASQPTLSGLLAACNDVVAHLSYSPEVKGNVRGAIQIRLTSLMNGAKGCMLNVKRSTSMKELLAAPTVIELSAIGDDDEKAFLLGCLLLRLAQQRQADGLCGGVLRHVTLIEEAHRLLRNSANTVSTVVANPRAQAVETFSNMVAELRAYGEGLMVIDQMPSKLVPDIIRNSAIKIVHRLTAAEERVIMGGAMALNEAQAGLLAGLPSGQAIVYSDGTATASRISIPDHAGREGYAGALVADDDIRMLMGDPALCGITPSAPLPSMGVPMPEKWSELCQATCPRANCDTARLARKHIDANRQLVAMDFNRAMANGFDALWRLGKRIASELWPLSDPYQSNRAFCVAMSMADSVGLTEADQRVLCRNLLLKRNEEIGVTAQPRVLPAQTEFVCHPSLRLVSSDSSLDVVIHAGAIAGRKPGANIIIFQHPSVSGRHAEFRYSPSAGWTIADLGSTNGTAVSASADWRHTCLLKPHESTSLNDGDHVLLGRLSLRVKITKL